MISNSMPEREKETLTGCVSFYTQWIDICVCIRVQGLHFIFFYFLFWIYYLFSDDNIIFYIITTIFSNET